MKPIYAETCVDAWLQGCEHLLCQDQDDWRDYNLISEIKNPLALFPNDHAVVDLVSHFLRDCGALPFSTVVNTIFPAQLFQRYGVSGVYDRYVSDILPLVRKHPDCTWGTYAQRILSRDDANGAKFSPLKDLVEKLKKQLSIQGTNRGTYELGTMDILLDIPIYNPASSDRNRPNGGPCLSHISVKLTADHRVMLTAIYRSHYWVQRTLGNLFGLAHLQHFIATEVGLEMGPLICHSTMAQLELNSGRWNKKKVLGLVAGCQNAYIMKSAA